MILVDTSVWVDHFRSRDGALAALLDAGAVLTHPVVIGEIALGNLTRRGAILESFAALSGAAVATDAEVLAFIDRHEVFGRGIGYADAHLLASTALTAGARLWTRDKRLHAITATMGLAMT